MTIHLRPAVLDDVAFLANVVITATMAQGRFPSDADVAEYRAGYEDWTRETILGSIPDCTLSVIEYHGCSIGRLRVVRTSASITLGWHSNLASVSEQADWHHADRATDA